MNRIILLFLFIALNDLTQAQSTASSCCSVIICGQTWMTHNLETSYYRNGDPVPQVTDATTWSTLTTGAWCWYNNDSASYSKYGKLYNWYAVMDPRGLAPWTWHLPSDAEWSALVTCLGGSAVAGGKMKEVGTNWLSPNFNATNSSGFTALPAGGRFLDGTFHNTGANATFWSTTFSSASTALNRGLFNTTENISNFSGNQKIGVSVRCIKD
ncbi:MAG: fibrobacter succinogenes major paralogous domain-containing protein [Ferruginibacter sp.]